MTPGTGPQPFPEGVQMRVGFKRSLPDRQLWAYSAVGGSLAVLISGLIPLLVPNRWALPVWVGLAVILCTAVGLVAPGFFRGEPPAEDEPPANPYFGPKWDAPATDHARQAPTPVGQECVGCRVPVAEGDQGFLMGYLGSSGAPGVVPYHRECLFASTSGHLVGICPCTHGDGEYTPAQSRADALEAWARLSSGWLDR